jgi:alkylation response protein AidB-like acyl-CoA dehydrogenase
MDFDFSEDEQAFIHEVQDFLAEQAELPYADEIMAPDREADSMLADSPERRAFNKALAERGYLGMSWDPEYGGRSKPGIYEYLVNEELASVGAPLIGKGVGCIGKTLIRHGNERLKTEFLPQILNGEIEFALGYSEPGAGSDLASLALKAEKDGEHWVLNGQKRFTTSAHFAEWIWLAARTDPTLPKHKGISVFLVPMDSEGITIQAMDTMAAHRTNEVFFDNVRIHEDYLVGELNRGWTYICEALDYERFTLYTIGPLKKKFDRLCELVKSETVDGEPLSKNPIARRTVARFAAEVEMAMMLQRRVITRAAAGEVPTVEAAMCKLWSTELGQRMANEILTLLGPAGTLRKGSEHAPMNGKWEGSYRGTVVDTIGGGSSQVQRNIIARRGLGLPAK